LIHFYKRKLKKRRYVKFFTAENKVKNLQILQH